MKRKIPLLLLLVPLQASANHGVNGMGGFVVAFLVCVGTLLFPILSCFVKRTWFSVLSGVFTLMPLALAASLMEHLAKLAWPLWGVVALNTVFIGIGLRNIRNKRRQLAPNPTDTNA